MGGGGHLGTPVHTYRDQAALAGGGVALADSPNWTGSHVWDQEDAGTTSVPTPVALQHRNNAAGTPAAGYGVGQLFKLDSSARNLRTAAEIDVVWSTATDASEVAVLPIKAMLAGTLTEIARLNGTGPDVDATFSFGRMLIDSRSTDAMCLSHRDMTTTTQLALMQLASGETRVNGVGTPGVKLNSSGTTKIQINSTGIGFYATTPVAQPNLTGVKSGGTALTSVVAALVALGLVTDATT